MFDYLAILICVILGLALTHLLIGVSRLMQTRHEVRLYWAQLAWTFNVILYILALWWGMFWWKHLQSWTVQEFFFLALYTIVVFLLASALFPHEYGPGHDCEAYFFRNKSWFSGLQIAAFLFDVPETLMKSLDGLRGVPVQYFLFLPTVILIGIIGLWSDNRKVHAALPFCGGRRSSLTSRHLGQSHRHGLSICLGKPVSTPSFAALLMAPKAP